MNKTRLQQAVSAVLAMGAAAGAHAVDITTVPAANILLVSGSTAIDGGLGAYERNSTTLFCNANSTAGGIDVYSGTLSGQQFIATACAAGAGASPVPADTLIAVIKEDTGGSLFGITPVAIPSTLNYPVVSTLTATNCATNPPTTPAGQQTQTVHSVCTGYTSALALPNLGFSDVDAGIFGASSGTTTTFPTIDIIFDPPVSLGLFHALQQIQGLTVNDENVGNIPSLTFGQLAAIYQGTLSSWTKVVNSAGAAVSAQSVSFGNSNLSGTNHICYDGTAFSTLADCQSGTLGPVVAPSSSTVFVCQRGQSSGTEQTAQVFYNDLACGAGVLAFAGPAKPGTSCKADGCGWNTATYGNVANFAGNGTGDVLSCLIAHDEAGQFAVGIASIDNGFGSYQSNVARKDFRYIRINEVMGSLENVAAGKHLYWAQSAGYVPASGATNAATGVAGQIVTAISSGTTAISNVATIKGLNTALQYTLPAFDGGFLAIPGAAATPNHGSDTLATFRGNPVNSYHRTTAGGASNNCIRPTLSSSAPDAADTPVWQTP